MTNTLNTPIEVLERTFPLRVTRYEFADATAVEVLQVTFADGSSWQHA